MVARIRTVAFQGIDVRPVDVEVQMTSGVPAFNIVGLPDKAVGESRERVRSALHAMGLSLPAKRLTVNLAPADLGKEGSHYDLPIALGLLAVMDVLPKDELSHYVVLGELSLDAGLRNVQGVLPTALYAANLDHRLICPAGCGSEAAWAGEDLDIIAPQSLIQLINHFKGTQILRRPEIPNDIPANDEAVLVYKDLADVKGQESAKRALEITAAGGHNLMMIGPPGSGKSMLAACIPGLLPPMSAREALEVSMVNSLAGSLPEHGLLTARPYRDPHHSASTPALVGGGHKVRPGEISLAHNGILFLDELPEFSRDTLESLRQPMETGEASIARANGHVTYPARFQLIAAMNPCRCGYFGDDELSCTKVPKCAADYQNKLSGPLLDRIDLQIEVPPVPVKDLSGMAAGEPSRKVRARVIKARELQLNRAKAYQDKDPKWSGLNAHASGSILDAIAPLSPDAQDLFSRAADSLRLSARAWHRMLRVARTIADLEGQEEQLIQKHHVAEAISYRRRQPGRQG